MRARPDIDTCEAWREHRAHRIAWVAEAVALAAKHWAWFAAALGWSLDRVMRAATEKRVA